MELLASWSIGVIVASAGGYVVWLELKRREKLPPVPRLPMQQQRKRLSMQQQSMRQQQSKSQGDK